MQTVPGYPTSIKSETPTLTVTHKGTVRKASSFSVDRVMHASLPAEIGGGTGGGASTGSVDWVAGDMSTSVAVHPWDQQDFPPKQYEPLTVDCGYGKAQARLLTGLFNGPAGQMVDNSASSGVIDGYDTLDKPITIEPLLSRMPPLGDRSASGFTYRYIGLTGTYFTDRLLRTAGFHATPPRVNNCVVSAPLMGSSWPEAGTLYRSSDTTFLGSPSWIDVPWGQAAYSLEAAYYPFLSSVNGMLNQSMQITAMVGPTVYGTYPSDVSVNWAGNNYLRLRVVNNRAIYVQSMSDGAFKDVCSLPTSAAATADTFTVRFDTTGVVTLRASNGAVASGTFTRSTTMRTTALSYVSVYVPRASGVALGGVQVAFSITPSQSYTRTAHLTPTAYRQQLEASPYLEGQSCLQLLEEQRNAECAAWWIDEAGHFRWVNRDVLLSSPVVDDLNPIDHIENVGWQHNDGSVRSQVVVRSRRANPEVGPHYKRLAYQGSTVELLAGESYVEIISPPAGVDWITVDENMRKITEPGASAEFNLGYGSFVGMTAIFTDGTNPGDEVNTGQYTDSLTRITPQAWKFKVTMSSTISSDLNMLKTPGDGFTTAFWPKRRDMSMPIIRCKGENRWEDVTTVGVNLGPTNAPVYEHQAGFWVQHPAELQRIADDISAVTMAPQPRIPTLNVIPNDLRQRGDIIYVRFGNVRLRVLVEGISDSTSISGGQTSKSQSLNVRVLDIAREATLADHDRVWTRPGDTLTLHDTLLAGKTLAQHDATPLERS